MTLSELFTDGEIKALCTYLQGDKSDKNGLISRKVRKKMKEIIDWYEQNRDILEQFR